MRSLKTLLALGATATSATHLWIADYSGVITTADLLKEGGTYALTETSKNTDCAPNPSWLTVDATRRLMFCLQESMAGTAETPGNIVSFILGRDDGSLTLVKNAPTLNGPVAGTIYGHGHGDRGLVAAHYGGSAVTTWSLTGKATFHENEKLPLDGTLGPNQAATHPHEAVIDPSGQYILVPDLGADLVRVFSWDMYSLKLKALDPLKTTPGYGPRHLVFYRKGEDAKCPTCGVQMYLVGELSGMITSFAVTYDPKDGEGLTFKNISSSYTQPDNPSNAPAEIAVDPKGRYLVVSNRDTSADATGSKGSLATYCVQEDGSLEAQPRITTSEKLGAGYVRHFSMNKNGTLVAVGLQHLNSTLVLARDASTGDIDPTPLAELPAGGNVVNVVWDE